MGSASSSLTTASFRQENGPFNKSSKIVEALKEPPLPAVGKFHPHLFT